MRTYKYIALAAMGLLFAACEKDDITPSAQNDTDVVRINASIGSVTTRTELDVENVSFVDGDKIYVENASRTTKNTANYTLTAGVWETSTPICWTNGMNTFRAVYPANASFETFAIPQDQSNLSAADWMIANTTVAKSDASDAVNLTFQHQLSMVTVEIDYVGSEYKGDGCKLLSGYFYPNETTVDNQHVTFAESYVQASMTHPNSPVFDKQSVWRAVLRPGKYLADSKFMQINIQGVPALNVKANDLLVSEGLKAGYDYKFKVKIGKDLVEVTGVEVTPWIEVEMGDGLAFNEDALSHSVSAAGFENGQIMTVVAKTSSTTSSAQYTYNESLQKWVTSAALIVNDINEVTDVYAWVGYPSTTANYSAAITSNEYLTDAAGKICDQSAGYQAKDWMVAKSAIALPTKANGQIDVEFVHAMAKVTLNSITYSSEFETTPSVTNVRFISRPCLSYDNATGIFATGSQNGVDYASVIPYVVGTTYSALLMPNSSENPAETKIMTLKVNGVEQSVTMTGALEPGKHYTFDLKVTVKGAVLVPVDADLGWNDEVEL